MDHLRVIVIDDHEIVRLGCRHVLEQTSDIEIVAEASDGESAYRLFSELHPDVLILDVTLPGMSGIEATRRIVARDPHAAVLIYTGRQGTTFGSQALQVGARGYVTKASPAAELVDAIRAVAHGRRFISHDMAQQLAMQLSPGQGWSHEALSPRELEVLRLLAAGNALGEVAHILSLSEKTVANYQSAMRRKLDAKTTAQVLWIARRRGLIADDG